MKIGLEIHQRLMWKLFCDCSPDDQSEEFSIRRKLNLSKSEIGDFDEAARLELLKDREYIYVGNRNSCCLVELDEEPPHMPNRMAIEVAVRLAKTFHMYIPKRIRFMRKIVVDGSNVSGFQRSGVVGLDGYVEIDGKRYGIDSLCLEEESADLLEDSESYRKYHLSRLGIALLEISTSPNISSGQEAKRVAEYIGLMLRLSGYVARGIGTIRQDLNVSVNGGNRVEIKGAQELEMIPTWIDNEIKRQQDLITLISRLKSSGLYDLPEFQPIDVTDMILNNQKLSKFLKQDSRALLLRYPGYRGVFSTPIGLRRYGSELSDYGKLAGVKGMIHSDESEKYDLKHLSDYVGSDGWVMVIDKPDRAIQALNYIYRRSKMDYVPKETRKALKDGSTEFMRPLPGAARMYPETDIPLIDIPDGLNPLPTPQEIISELSRELNHELANRIIWNRRFQLYQDLKNKVDPKVVAITLEDTLVSIRREMGKEPDDSQIRYALELYRQNRITKRAIKEVIRRLMESKPIDDLYRFSKDRVEELLKIHTKEEIVRKYPLNVDPEQLFNS